MALPVDSVIRVHLRNSQKNFDNPKSETGVSLCALYLPPNADALAKMAGETIFHSLPIDYVSTAQTLLFHHPDVITKDPALADRIINTHMIGDKRNQGRRQQSCDPNADLGAPHGKRRLGDPGALHAAGL